MRKINYGEENKKMKRRAPLSRAGNSLIGVPRESIVFCPKMSDSLTIAHLLWATWANRSWFLIFDKQPERFAHILIFGEQPERFAHIAHQKRGNERIAYVFCFFTHIKHTKKIRFYIFLPKSFERISHLLIYHERPGQIAYGRSFVLSVLRDLLTVAHFLWATWAICSRLLICLERSARIAHSHSFDLREMSEWANERWVNERIPSPAFK